MAKVKLKWKGNISAQKAADAAYAKLKPKKTKARGKAARKARRKAKRAAIMDGTAPPKQEQKPQRFASYYDYIESDSWHQKRRKAIKQAGGKCDICKSSDNLRVHHRTYKRLYREAPEDLQVLCDGCHANHHEEDKGHIKDPLTAAFRQLVRSS